MLVNGKWVADWQPVQAKDEKGGFVRQTSSFRNWVTADGSAGPTGEGGFIAEKGRYHLYVAYICPFPTSRRPETKASNTSMLAARPSLRTASSSMRIGSAAP